MIVVLAGGTGGAKLARGLAAVTETVVVANTGDDVEIYGAYVCPDPDLVLFRLADRLNAQGWGLEGDTWQAMDRLRARGEEIWFNLGDEDLEIGRDRARRLAAGERLTDTIDALRATLGVDARVLPMCDEPVRTHVGGVPFQEWMIRLRGADPGPVTYEGLRAARVTPEVTDALARADAVVIGPSNPVLSIAPILGVPGLREAIRGPVIAVSPFVKGEIIKGPTAAFVPSHADAVAHYGALVDAWVADEPADLVTDVLMDGTAGAERLATEILDYVKGSST